MHRETCWVWFKGGLNETGYWKAGFTGTKDQEPGILIESSSYVTCRVPEWRVALTEPKDLFCPPEIPDDSSWKIY